MSNPLLVVTAAFIAGAGLGHFYYGPLSVIYMIDGLYLVFGIAYFFRCPWHRVLYLLAVLFFLAGMTRYLTAGIIPESDISHFAGQGVTIAGTVADVPQITNLPDGTRRLKFKLTAETVGSYHGNPMVSGGILVYVAQKNNDSMVAYGQKVLVTGMVVLPHGYNNPGMIDMVKLYQRQGITARMATSAKLVKIITVTGQSSWRDHLAVWHERIKKEMLQAMPPKDAAMLNGILFGGYEGIDRQVVRDFATTGIIHILSVSGSHIALVAGFIYGLGKRFKWHNRLIAAVASAAILFYAIFSGMTPPVVRSAFMGLVLLLATVLGREKDAATALAFSALAMVARQPGLIDDISFQLSFGSTAGLIFLYPPIAGKLPKLPGGITDILSATLAAQAAVLPFLAWYFNSFSLSSFIANILVVPPIELMVLLGLLGILAGLLFSMAGHLALICCSLLIGLVVQINSFLAMLPASKIYIPAPGILAVLVYYFLLAWLFGYLPKYFLSPARVWTRWPARVSGVVLFLAISFLFYSFYPQPVVVHFIDVGQGDATLITTPHGRAVLVDTGGSAGSDNDFDVGERVTLPYLKHYGINSLDYLVLTHGHQDHAGGAAFIVKSLPVKNIVLAREDYSPAVQAIMRLKGSSAVIPAYRGERILLDGVLIQVLHAASSTGQVQRNEVSSVVRVSYGKYSFLLTGDLEKQGEAAMLTNGVPPTTVLKVGHHGAKTSTSEEFLQALKPQYAVISVGYNNHFGHPHAETIQKLLKHTIKIYRTDRQGAVVFSTDGETLAVKTFTN
ncbi:metallo-beta-lactamase [Lucifera butyrica]|uniref:Metallo-beta-lactamase n=1 Tax=Lucifera butyrica TaxID=1351585 RepID=A0A498R4N8_9FIRM|nr:DNA internalization-related competence protein ComEC/Rec2 [Lucifera butyrica]VBB06109.1 metallo-beta-lactamase [Lucifera butyrica]